MAGIGPAKVAAVKGAQPADYDYVAQLVKNAQQLQLSGQSATQDVPGLMTGPGSVIPGNAFDAYRLPARVDPEQIIAAQHELARAEALRGAASFVPATVFGVKHGRAAGAPPGGGGPIWDAVRSQITEPLTRAQLSVDQTNQANDVINKIVGMNAGARGQDRGLATQLAGLQGTAKVAALDRATQQKQFEESQATTKRGQDMTLLAAQARLNGPNQERMHKARAIADAADRSLDDLEGLVRGGNASALHLDVAGNRYGTSAGVDTANTVGMAANHLGQIAELRGLRGKMQDEISHELTTGVGDPDQGLRVVQKWRDFVNEYRAEMSAGRNLPGPDPVAGQPTPAAGAGGFDPSQPIGGE